MLPPLTGRRGQDYHSAIGRKELSEMILHDVLSIAGMLVAVVGMLWAFQSENLGMKRHA